MNDDQVPFSVEALAEAEIFPHAYLPAAAAYCRRLTLAETVNALVSSEMALNPGLVVQAMGLDTLGGRSPLYRVEDVLAGQDTELLLGEEVDPSCFSDTTLARSLDAIFRSGTGHVLTECGLTAACGVCPGPEEAA